MYLHPKKNIFFFTEKYILRTSWIACFNKKMKLKTYVIMFCKTNSWLERADVLNLMLLITSSVMNCRLGDYRKNLRDFTQKRQLKQTSTVKEPSVPFHTLVKRVDAEEITIEEIRTLNLLLKTNIVTSKLESLKFPRKIRIQILKSCLHEQLIRIMRVTLIFGNTVIFVINPRTLFQFNFSNNVKKMKESRILILDRNHQRNLWFNTLKHTRIKFIQMHNLHRSL